MGIRESLNQNPQVVTGVTVGVIVLTLAVIVYQVAFSGPGGEGGPRPTNEAFYTSDDGKTWFEDSRDKVLPFQKDGKPAVRARVFSCDGGKTRFVGFLERHTEQTRKNYEQMKNDPSAHHALGPMLSQGIEVKRPGDKEWSGMNRMDQFIKVQDVKCPDGSTNNLNEVEP